MLFQTKAGNEPIQMFTPKTYHIDHVEIMVFCLDQLTVLGNRGLEGGCKHLNKYQRWRLKLRWEDGDQAMCCSEGLNRTSSMVRVTRSFYIQFYSMEVAKILTS